MTKMQLKEQPTAAATLAAGLLLLSPSVTFYLATAVATPEEEQAANTNDQS
jgi:hypothetical protein